MSLLYLDIRTYGPLFADTAASIRELRRTRDVRFIDQAVSRLKQLADAHIYFELLLLEWRQRLWSVRRHDFAGAQKLIPPNEIAAIPAELSLMQRQIMELFRNVLDIDGADLPAMEKMARYYGQAGKELSVNIKKSIDYSTVYAGLDTLTAANLPQMELYCEVGRLVSGRPEKGAAVAAAEYLRAAYPDISGSSPQDLRRMRDFYRTYEDAPEIMAEAMAIGWTQNAVILEAELTLQEKAWYIRAVRQFGWSKLKLAQKLAVSAHLEMALDLTVEVCYTEENSAMECVNDDKYPLYLPRQHMSKPYGRICDEGPGEEIQAGSTVLHRVRRHQHRGDWQFSLSSSPQEAGRARHQL